ncbi:hypothetical protein [Gloeocapsopsis sp. IPPAS B-1203]|uniref:Crp/Fnr family transcriptional regulator n=1 Tax=Gloeocapsopsis sp. IPPAS B-1203 TaxID=2049454 RepID=UPI0025A204C6|nr:hypothetical protein [Gloeocapsopsis sp. IPPAS B-1203]
MSVHYSPELQIENQLLAALPTEDYQRLLPEMETVSLPQSQILWNAEEVIEYVYFPNRALISLVTIMESGEIVEVGIVGREGMTGLTVCWGGDTTTLQAIVQIPGSAIRMSAKFLKLSLTEAAHCKVYCYAIHKHCLLTPHIQQLVTVCIQSRLDLLVGYL